MKGSKKEQQNSEGNVTLTIVSLGKTTTEKFFSKNAKAIDLLKHKHDVKTTIGGYIKCIDGVCVYSDYNWVFYVNNKSSPSFSVLNYIVKRGDEIRFEFTRKNVGD